MNKKLISLLTIALGLFVVMLLFVRADTVVVTGSSLDSVSSDAAPAPSGDSIACVNTAVQNYQAAVRIGTAGYLQAVAAADAAREMAMSKASAGGISDKTQAEIDKVMSVYSAQVQAAKAKWKAAGDAAQATFEATARNCHAPQGILNGLHIPTEPSV